MCRQNLIWHFAGSSFVGCIHSLRSGAVSELLSWIRQEEPIILIQLRWKSLAGPITYMRPTAAPKLGNIFVAEKLFTDLNLTQEDMRRIYLTPDEIPDCAFLYRAPSSRTAAPTIFGNVAPREASIKGSKVGQSDFDSFPPTAINFTKFARDVLPTARKLEYKLPEDDHIFFFITGRPNSTPLMQWHTPDNLASWYVNARKRPIRKHKLAAGWALVPYITAFPNMWPDLATLTSAETFPDRTKHIYGSLLSDETFASFKYKHHRIHYLVGLGGAQDDPSSLCLFPTFLKSEFHGVRSTIETYSNKGRVEGQEAGKDAVAGVEITKKEGQQLDNLFRVTDWKGRVETYKLVLW